MLCLPEEQIESMDNEALRDHGSLHTEQDYDSNEYERKLRCKHQSKSKEN